MITQEVVKNIKWLDVAVDHPKRDKNIVLIVTIFDTHEEGKNFIKLLAKNDFGFAATTVNGLYLFHINFDKEELGIQRPTTIPKEQYHFKKWYREGKDFFITNGVWLGMERLYDMGEMGMVPIKKLFFE